MNETNMKPENKPNPSQEENINKKVSKGIGRKLRNIGLTTLAIATAIEGAGAVATELTNNVPMTGETIKADLAWPWNLGKSATADIQKILEKQPEGIYNFPDKGTLNAANSIVITDLNAIKDISPLPATPTLKNDIYLLQPVENLNVVNSVQYGMDLEGKSDINPIFQEKYRQEAIKNNVRNMLLLKNIPKDSILLAPIDGTLRYNDINAPDGAINGLEIFFKAPDGTEVIISLADYDQFLTPLIDTITPFTGNNESSDVIYIQVKRGQPIAKTLQLGDVFMEATAQQSLTSADGSHPTNINLISIPDPKTGKQATVIAADR